MIVAATRASQTRALYRSVRNKPKVLYEDVAV